MTFHRKKYIAAAAGFLLLFALAAGILWFVYRPKSQVLIALAGTYKESEWIPVLKESDFLKQDNLSARAKWHSGAASGNLDLAFAGEETGIFFRTGILGTSIDVRGVLSEETLKLQIPRVGDVVYTHELTGETPFFDKLFGKRNAESIDVFLKALSNFRWERTQGVTLSSEELAGMLADMPIEKTGCGQYEIEGKKVICKGYSLDLAHSVLGEKLGFSPEEMYVYVYRGKLAALRVKALGEMWELRFLGGKNRDSKIMLVKEGEFSVTVKGEQQGEDFPVSIKFQNREETVFSLRGELKKDALNAEIRSAQRKGKDLRIEGEISLVPGAEMQELPGDTMDLEQLSETEKQILIAVFRLLRIG